MKSRNLLSTLALVPLALALFGAAGCSRQSSSPPMTTSNDSVSTQATTTVHITDLNGVAIPNAQVLIGTGQDKPFAGNFIKTNATGDVTVPAAWTDAEDLTVDADGYVRTTYVAQMPVAQTLVMRPALVQQPRTVSGTTTGFGNLPNDGTLDVGLVFKTFDLSNLTNFEITDVVSARMDAITVAGKTEQIPSNVTIPPQSETYIFIPVKFNKPTYSLDMYSLGTFNLMAVHAQAPFSKLAKGLMGGQSLLDQINELTFVSGGEEQITVTENGAMLDIPIGTIAFNSKFNWSSPAIDTTTTMMLAVAMASDGNTYYPTDIKRFTASQTIEMHTVASSPSPKQNAGLVLSILRSSDDKPVGAAAEQLSLTFLPISSMTPPSFLELLPSPQVSGPASNPTITQKIPAAQGLKPLMTTMTGSKIDPTNALLLTPTWDVFANGWVDHVDLPAWPGESAAVLTSSMRWSVSFGAEDATGGAVPLGPAALQSATHLTRAAVDL